jgi:hypothetical protein
MFQSNDDYHSFYSLLFFYFHHHHYNDFIFFNEAGIIIKYNKFNNGIELQEQQQE